jgi:hypothetical protein
VQGLSNQFFVSKPLLPFLMTSDMMTDDADFLFENKTVDFIGFHRKSNPMPNAQCHYLLKPESS